MLKRLQEKGITILVSTPYMDEAALCDRIALIQNGEILKTDTPDHLSKSFDYPLYKIKTNDMYNLLLDLKKFEGMHSTYPFGDSVHYAGVKTSDIITLEDHLRHFRHTEIEIHKINPGIEDVFMEFSNKQKKN